MDEASFPTYSYKVDTPDGMMFVQILEDDQRRPFQILIMIGKAGSSLNAWSDAVARLVSRLLPAAGVHGAIEELSNITSDRPMRRLARGETIHSAPEGIAYALLKYTQEKFKHAQAGYTRPGRASLGD